MTMTALSNEDIRKALRSGVRVDQVCDAAFNSGAEDDKVLDLLVDAKRALMTFLEAERELFEHLNDSLGWL